MSKATRQSLGNLGASIVNCAEVFERTTFHNLVIGALYGDSGEASREGHVLQSSRAQILKPGSRKHRRYQEKKRREWYGEF